MTAAVDVDRSLIDDTLTAIDRINATDHNMCARAGTQLPPGITRPGDDLADLHPRALLQGRLSSLWLERLRHDGPSARPELEITARAHHLRRWELARSTYPEGRAGYLRWRRDNKRHQVDSLAEIMERLRWPSPSVERARRLLSRVDLAHDPDTATLEDVACLAFLETDYQPMVERLDRDHMIKIVAKTLAKMTAAAIDLAATIPLQEEAQSVLTTAARSIDKGTDDGDPSDGDPSNREPDGRAP